MFSYSRVINYLEIELDRKGDFGNIIRKEN